MLMARANTAKEGGRRRALHQRQTHGKPQDQNGQCRHKETGGKAEAKDPTRVQAVDGGGDCIEAGRHDRATIAQTRQGQQAQQREKVNRGTVENSPPDVQPMAGKRNAPGGDIESAFLPGISWAERPHPVAAECVVEGDKGIQAACSDQADHGKGKIPPRTVPGLQQDPRAAEEAQRSEARVQEGEAAQQQGQ